ncbi:Cleavage and polyadenylation specificity factor subunit [Echinococcus granulosus]|uniref:Cleavage and polyadenylation specificity factor subunit n=1 Tax=Echinococcus granulosus TaxID=6210 RepID=W6UPF0_ECHGR|nr:Cleavage and polyadenylation specificity factor subunit [Echinococcus granulosus]EUB60152.1 Cleavage and polyadenylation specificity factor subunit [Echinococcus granulosus]
MDLSRPTNFSTFFRQISSPTAVTHSVYCNILHPRHRNLVIVRGNLLEVYDIRGDSGHEYLAYVTGISLYEEVKAISSVHFCGDSLDSILLSFSEAKVSALSFDIYTYEFKTCSLHAYEQSALRGGRLQFTRTPLLRVDPLQRCAVTLVYDRFLAVLPFRRVDALISPLQSIDQCATPVVDSPWQGKANAPILSTFTTYLSTSTGEPINHVIDMQFLFGFNEPTLLVLYEPSGTWTGRVSVRRDTCCIVALSINLQERTNPIIWFQELLPYDCHTVLPIPMPIGGVIVLATNSIIYLKQTLPSRGLPLNYYTKVSTNFPFRQEVPPCGPLSLDGCRASLLPSSEILIVTREGAFYILTLLLEKANNTVTELFLSKVGSYVQAEVITVMDNQWLFFGSCLSDSLLMKFNVTQKSVNNAELPKTVSNIVNGENDDTERLAKKSRSSPESEALGATVDSTESDPTDVDLYGPNALRKPTRSFVINDYAFTILDTLRNIGPVTSITAGEVPCLATGQTDPTDESLTQAQAELAHTELIACLTRKSGVGSAILQLHRSVRARGLTAFELPEYSSLWSLYGPPIGTFTEQRKAESDELQNEEITPLSMKAEEKESGDPNDNGEMFDYSVVPQSTKDEQLPSDADDVQSTNTFPVHSYLLLTREDSSMILEVGKEIVELEVSGFKTTENTVIAANLGFQTMRTEQEWNLESAKDGEKELEVGLDYPYIIQVCPTSFRLLNGPHLVEELHLTNDSRISLASVADPYILVSTEDDDLILVALQGHSVSDCDRRRQVTEKEAGQKHRLLIDRDPNDLLRTTSESLPSPRHLELSWPKVTQIAPPICFCLYHDETGRLAQWLGRNVDPNLLWNAPKGATEKAKAANINDPINNLSSLDEEDILLYGQVLDVCKRERRVGRTRADKENTQLSSDFTMEETGPRETTSMYFAFIVFSNGVLEIYSIPLFVCLFEMRQFNELPNLLVDSLGMPEVEKTKQAGLPVESEDLPPPIREIAVFPMDREQGRPVLFVRTDREVVCYEALCALPDEAVPLTPMPPNQALTDCVHSRCLLRWIRLPVSCPLMAPSRLRSDPRVVDIQAKLLSKSNVLHPFESIGGHRGIFVCGSHPVWMFCNRLGHINVFPHTIDGIITSFAPLNIASCPDGFVYFTHTNEMKLATLPPGYSYEQRLGIGTIPVNGCPHFVQYHLESKTYVVISSTEAECRTIVRLNGDGNKEEELVDRPDTCIFPKIDVFKLQALASLPADNLRSAPRFEVVPNSTLEFEPFESVSCLVTVQLSSDLTFDETKDYLALGANLSYGEEIPVRGRIILIDIIEVVPEPGQPLTRHKVKTVYDGDQKGPVTALTSCQGYLISAVGQKIYIWALKGGDLEGVAFVDTDLYIHTLLCVNNLILAADVLKSIQLLRFQSNMRVLSLVSRDTAFREVFTANFFVDGVKLGFLVTDNLGNLMVYSYDPEELASCSGRRLVRRVDMRLPSVATACLRVGNRFRHPLLAVKALQAEANELRRNRNKLTTPAVGSGLLAALEYERTRHSVYLGTRNGALYLITPIRDKMSSRLKIVEKNLLQCIGCTAGLIPRVCRQYSRPLPELSNPCRNVVDGDLIQRYLLLPHGLRIEVAKKSGQSLNSTKLDPIYKLYRGEEELFYFPLAELPTTSKLDNFADRALSIDPWPAYATERTNTDTQILRVGNRLLAQSKEQSKLKPPPKPRFLILLENKIMRDMKKLGISEDTSDPLRLQELLWVASFDADKRVNEFQNRENTEIDFLKSERNRDKFKLDKVQQECVELQVTVSKLMEQLGAREEACSLEADGRKLLVTEVNDINSRLRELEALTRADMGRNTDDPIKLKILVGEYEKALERANTELNRYRSDFEERVPRVKYEEAKKQLEAKTREVDSLNEELESAASRYSLLKDHCETLNTWRDLYNSQILYITRVLAAKSDAAQKVEYINALLFKYRKIAREKTPEQLADFVTHDLAKAEAGGLPSLTRPTVGRNRSKPEDTRAGEVSGSS